MNWGPRIVVAGCLLVAATIVGAATYVTYHGPLTAIGAGVLTVVILDANYRGQRWSAKRKEARACQRER